MKKLLVTVIAVIGLIGCATTENFEKKVSVHVGQTENQLVAAEGIPTSMYENEGIRYLTYSRSESGVIPGQPARANTVMIGGKPYTNMVGGTPAIGYSSSCTVIFKVVNKVVVSYEYKGDSCRSY